MDASLPVPIQCHLWQHEDPVVDVAAVHRAFAQVQSYLEDSHHIRRLLRCEQCGQLFYYGLSEVVDWIGGEDPQFRIYIPVASERQAERFSTLGTFDLRQFVPRLQVDWPAGQSRPIARWIRD